DDPADGEWQPGRSLTGSDEITAVDGRYTVLVIQRAASIDGVHKEIGYFRTVAQVPCDVEIGQRVLKHCGRAGRREESETFMSFNANGTETAADIHGIALAEQRIDGSSAHSSH